VNRNLKVEASGIGTRRFSVEFTALNDYGLHAGFRKVIRKSTTGQTTPDNKNIARTWKPSRQVRKAGAEYWATYLGMVPNFRTVFRRLNHE
jgi:hypothetical protein